tara:strand:- start:77 stop:289 length:213 start_codon:yes stop_codon:yes gene_type:complete
MIYQFHRHDRTGDFWCLFVNQLRGFTSPCLTMATGGMVQLGWSSQLRIASRGTLLRGIKAYIIDGSSPLV